MSPTSPIRGSNQTRQKGEIVARKFDRIKDYSIFKDFKCVLRADLKILGASILKRPVVDKALEDNISELKRTIGPLLLFHAHGALGLLRNVLTMSKLLYILPTSPCSGNNLLKKVFDETLRKGLTSILNVDISDDLWTQASPPVHMGGLGVRSAE